MNQVNLNEDIFGVIISYLDCKNFVEEIYILYKPTKFYLVNKIWEKLYKKYSKKCKYYYYENLNCCDCSIDIIKNKNNNLFQKLNNIKKVIKILNKSFIEKEKRGYVNTIHFENDAQVILANPYLNKFGFISHRCCNGLGVSYRTRCPCPTR
jgi:hypothetical protein